MEPPEDEGTERRHKGPNCPTRENCSAFSRVSFIELLNIMNLWKNALIETSKSSSSSLSRPDIMKVLIDSFTTVFPDAIDDEGVEDPASETESYRFLNAFCMSLSNKPVY